MKSLQKISYNDILANGFGSVAQECYLRIHEPALADQVYRKHGHAPDWDRLKRNPLGEFDHVAALCSSLFKIADRLDSKQKFAEADKIDKLINFIVEAQGANL